jgi:hypothetical protein
MSLVIAGDGVRRSISSNRLTGRELPGGRAEVATEPRHHPGEAPLSFAAGNDDARIRRSADVDARHRRSRSISTATSAPSQAIECRTGQSGTVDLARNADSQDPVATSADESFDVEAGRLATGQAATARLGKMGQ